MYLLFRYHDILPRRFSALGEGEKRVIRAFMHYEIEQMKEEIKAMHGA